MNTLKREPLLVRQLIVAVLAIVSAFIPSLDVGTVEGVAIGAIALLFGIDARTKVTPISDPKGI